MTSLSCSAFILVLSCASLAAGDAQPPAANPDALVLKEFKDRVDHYMDLRKRLEKASPPLKQTDNPAEIRVAQEALAAGIREARADARQGDIFTPEAAKLFRRLLSPSTKGPEGAETKKSIAEDAPTAVPLKVNARYPEGQPLPTVPPNVLANLPQLPETLEYRIVSNHLILLDSGANLIIDFIPNAIR